MVDASATTDGDHGDGAPVADASATMDGNQGDGLPAADAVPRPDGNGGALTDTNVTTDGGQLAPASWRAGYPLALGEYATCAVLSGGNATCWGRNKAGELGYQSLQNLGDDEVPAGIGSLAIGGKVVQVAAGSSHVCARLAAGNIRCWGQGQGGRLGYALGEDFEGVIGDDEAPGSKGDVALGGKAIDVAAGIEHTCAVLEGGGVRCWGYGGERVLGYGNGNDVGMTNTPADVGDIKLGGKAVAVSTRGMHACALLESGAVRCWGDNFYGQLGQGYAAQLAYAVTPADLGDVPLGGKAVQVVTGWEHTCALLEGGNVRCWGINESGELGYGNVRPLSADQTPAELGNVDIGGKVVQLAAVGYATCALLEGGAVRCWGDNARGRLGYGNTQDVGDDELPAAAGNINLGAKALFIAGAPRTSAPWWREARFAAGVRARMAASATATS